MNKFLTKIATFGLGMIMAIGVGVAAVTSDGFTRANAATGSFEKYSGEITEGDYLITYSGAAMNNTVSSSRLSYENVTVNNDIVSNPGDSLVWTIKQNGNYWTLQSKENSKYAAGTGAKNKAQLLDSGTDDKSLWTISGNGTYEFVNKANKAANVNSNLRKNGEYGFACYATGTGGALTLYKFTGGSESDPDTPTTPDTPETGDVITVEISTFAALSADLDNIISYSTAKGNGTSDPAVNNGQIRLYQNASGKEGGSITIIAKENYTIVYAEIGSSMATTLGISIDGGSFSTHELAASSTFKSGEISCSSVKFACFGTTSGTRLYVNYLKIGYISNSGEGNQQTTLSTPTNINYDSELQSIVWDSVANATSYSVSIGDGEAESVTETSYSVSDLEPGDYTINVVAKADGYNDSAVGSYDFTISSSAPIEGPAFIPVQPHLITENDIIIYVAKTSDGNFAISNSNGTGSAPSAVSVTITNDCINAADVIDTIKWNVAYVDGNLTFYPAGSTSTWLYCTATNNGVRVGTNAAKVFIIDSASGYLKHTGTSRFLGVYNKQDWRCYTSPTTANIANQEFAFFKYVENTSQKDITMLTSLDIADQTIAAGSKFNVDSIKLNYTVNDVAQEPRTLSVDTLNLKFTSGDTTLTSETEIRKTHNGIEVTASYTENIDGNDQNVTDTFILSVSDAQAIETATANYKWEQITSKEDIESGEKYLIVYKPERLALNPLNDPIDVTNKTLSLDDGILETSAFTIQVTEGGYKIFTPAGKTIGISEGVKDNGIRVSNNNETLYNAITFNEDGTANITCNGRTLRFNNNKDQMRFRYFNGESEEAVCLYKKVEIVGGNDIVINGVSYLKSLIDAYRLNNELNEFNICSLQNADVLAGAKEIFNSLTEEERAALSVAEKYNASATYLQTCNYFFGPQVNSSLLYVLGTNINSPETITLIIVSTLVIASTIFAIYYRKREENAR